MTNNKIKKGFAIFVLAVSFAMAASQSLIVNAGESDSSVKIGTAYIEGVNIDLEGDAVYGDGQYEMTWNISDADAVEASSYLNFNIKNENPYPLGESGKLKLSIDEIYIDGAEISVASAIEPNYGFTLDSVYKNTEVTNISCSLKELDVDITKDIKVVFSISGTTDTENYKPNKYVAMNPYGDINLDNSVNAVDASIILTEYAKTATGSESDLDGLQKVCADLNVDGTIDAIDASLVLSYYAYKATGGTKSIIDYLS